MTSERALAYGNVMRILRVANSTKLHPGEIAIIREAADELIFATHPLSPQVYDAAGAALDLLCNLTECGRWTTDGAERLADYLEDCVGEPVRATA